MILLHRITLALLIVGGLNWGLIAMGGYGVDVVAGIFGGVDGIMSRMVYGLVGLSALFQLGPSFRVLRRNDRLAPGEESESRSST